MDATEKTTTLTLSTPVADLPGVGKHRTRLFHRLGLMTVSDLLRHVPMRYQEEAAEDVIGRLRLDTIGSARGSVVAARWRPGYGQKKDRFEATLQDDTGTLSLVWFNGRHLRGKIHPGMLMRVQGRVRQFGDYPQMANPKWEILAEDGQIEAAQEKLRPIYPATDKLNSAVIEQVISDVLPRVLPLLKDPLDSALLAHHAMPSLADAFRMIHQPQEDEQAGAARRRLAFNELLLLQLGIVMKRAFVHDQLQAWPLRISDAVDQHIKGRFPFELTGAQQKVIEQIKSDLRQPVPMNRLLQGDVGSGKTVVALYAMLAAVADRRQAALMAPTELLAEQHFASISQMLEGSSVRLALLTGTRNGAGQAAARRQLRADIETGRIDLVVATHALLTESVRFRELAVVVIDEQHRFGVAQRAAFRQAGRSGGDDDAGAGKPRVPHHLVMTATPIPRTLSLTVFGDLDVSTITELPPGRTPIVNRVVRPEQSREVYEYLRLRLERGEQAYVVVPTIDANAKQPDEVEADDDSHLSARQLKSVNDHAQLLQQQYCQGFEVAAIHGRLARDEREAIMQRFRAGEVHVLVATTVIEVGVDVPNATVMVVEHAERFGLAQLHQLRGRIGRGDHGRQSLCVFIADPTTEQAQQRMQAIGSTNDGFRISEMDLSIRGMGEFFGTRQHGSLPLRVARIPDDLELLQLARRDAQKIIASDPTLRNPEHQLLRTVLMQQYGEALGLVDVG